MRLIDADLIIKDLSAMKTQLGYDAIDIDGMIKALKEAEEIDSVPPPNDLPPNDPLTLEELREMDGDPVWNDTVKKYALVDVGWWDGIGRTINSNGKYRLLDDRYYRRKPEEGET